MLKLTTSVADMRRFVTALKPTAPKRNSCSLPVLTGVRIDVTGGQATLTTTDLEMTTRIVGVPATGEGSTLLRLDDLVSSLRNAKGDVTIEAQPQPGVVPVGKIRDVADDETVYVTTSNGLAGFRPLPVEEYPRIAPDSERTLIGEVVTSLSRASRLASAAGTDDNRPVLTCVYADVKNQRLVSTDSYRLALAPAEVRYLGPEKDEKRGLDIVPAAFWKHLGKVSADTMTTVRQYSRNGRQEVVGEATLCGATVEITSITAEGEFPPYERLFPTSFPVKLALPGELIPALKALPGGSEPVCLTVKDEVLTVTYTVQDVGVRTLLERPAVDYEDGTVAFNPEYLAAGMEMCGGDIEIHFTDALKPAAMAGAGLWYLIMPVRTGHGTGGPSHKGHHTLTHELPVASVEDVADVQPAAPAPKRASKADLVKFLASVARYLPAEQQTAALALLETA